MLDWSDAPTSTLEVDGAKLEYAAWGPPPATAPTIVLMHEGLGCVALWRDFPQKLVEATGFGVFAYSRLGYGQSDPATLPKPIDFMTNEARQTLPRVLDQAGIERCVLLGHSDGATISAIYAGSEADMRVRGLVLMAPHFFTEPMGLASIAEAKSAFEQGDLRPKLAKYHKDAEIAFRGWNDTWLNSEFTDWDVSDVIDYFRVPTLAIQGRDDQYGTLAQVQIIEERAYSPVDLLVLDDCGHAPHQDKPAEVLGGIAEFVVRLMRIEAAEVEAG